MDEFKYFGRDVEILLSHIKIMSLAKNIRKG